MSERITELKEIIERIECDTNYEPEPTTYDSVNLAKTRGFFAGANDEPLYSNPYENEPLREAWLEEYQLAREQ